MIQFGREEVRMKRKTIGFILGAFAVALFMTTGFAQSGAVQSQWTDVPVKIDGLDQDWEGVTFVVDKKSNAEYAFKNDGENLYILFVFKDAVAKSTVDQLGMKIYYNAEGKKKKAEGLHFLRRSLTPQELVASLEARGEVLTEERKAELLKQPGFILFEGEPLGFKPNGRADSVPVEPPTFRAQQAAGQKRQPQQAAQPAGGRGDMTRGGQPGQRGGGKSVYEYRIPLDRNPYLGGIGTEPGKSLKLYFEWGGMTKEMMAMAMTRSAEGSTSAGARSVDLEQSLSGGSESIDSGGGGGGGMRRSATAKKHSFWVDVKLAGKIQ
jgi:hypothetical protein